jgi:hypothetical protein
VCWAVPSPRVLGSSSLPRLSSGRRLEPYWSFLVHIHPSSGESCHVSPICRFCFVVNHTSGLVRLSADIRTRIASSTYGTKWGSLTWSRKGMTRVFVVFSTIGTGATAERRSCAGRRPRTATPVCAPPPRRLLSKTSSSPETTSPCTPPKDSGHSKAQFLA